MDDFVCVSAESGAPHLEPMSDQEFRHLHQNAKNLLRMAVDYRDLSCTSAGVKLNESYLEDIAHLLEYDQPVPPAVWKRITAIPFHIAVENRERKEIFSCNRMTMREALALFFDSDNQNSWFWDIERINHMPPFARQIMHERFEFLFYYTVNVRAELEFALREQFAATTTAARCSCGKDSVNI